MLSDWEKGVLKQNRISADDVESVSPAMIVKFKDGSERQICEVWSRCMGYFRPYHDYNIGKKSEFDERSYFTEDKAVDHIALEDSCQCACAMAAE